MVADDAGLSAFNANSKFNTELAFLEQLFELGRSATTGWLNKHGRDVGLKSTLDIDTEFLGKAVKAPRQR